MRALTTRNVAPRVDWVEYMSNPFLPAEWFETKDRMMGVPIGLDAWKTGRYTHGSMVELQLSDVGSIVLQIHMVDVRKKRAVLYFMLPASLTCVFDSWRREGDGTNAEQRAPTEAWWDKLSDAVSAHSGQVNPMLMRMLSGSSTVRSAPIKGRVTRRATAHNKAVSSRSVAAALRNKRRRGRFMGMSGS